MSKLPLETRPLRLAPEVQKVVETRLNALNGKDLKAAQEAVLKVYHSGKQMPSTHWVEEYNSAINDALGV